MSLLDRILTFPAAKRGVSFVARAVRGIAQTAYLATTKLPNSPFTEQQYRSSVNEWTPTTIKTATRQADSGDLRLVGMLCEEMLADDRISGCLQETRVRGLLGLPIVFEKGQDSPKGEEVVAAVEKDYWKAFPEDALVEWMCYGIMVGIGVARLAPWQQADNDDGEKHVLPAMEVIHPSSLRQDQTTKQWYVRQQAGPDVLVTPGDGTWLVYTPYGTKRPWARGAWRSLALWWLLKLYAKNDWGRYSERHGMGLFVGTSPDISDPRDRAQLASDLSNVAKDSAFAVPPGFDVKLIESTANTWTTYQAQTNMANAAFAIRLLGQNLSTEVTGGSFAATQVHARVAASVIRADDETSRTVLHDQGLAWWAEFNYGDRNLAPWPKHDTTPPEDKKAKVDTQIAAANAAEKWSTLGVPVDILASAEDAGVIISAEGEVATVNKGEIFKYHLDYGVFTTNEIRASRGLPPIEGGDVPPEPMIGAPKSLSSTAELSRTVQLASGDNVAATSGFVEGQEYVDRLTAQTRDAASGELSPWIDQITEVIEGLEDTPDWQEQLKKKLVKLYGDGAGIEGVTERAMVLAALAGRTAVLQDV